MIRKARELFIVLTLALAFHLVLNHISQSPRGVQALPWLKEASHGHR